MEIIESKEAKRRHNKLESNWSEESKLSQEIMIAMLYRLENPISINKLFKRVQKIEEDLDHYIKNYPDDVIRTCVNCTGCQLYKLRGKDESKDCEYYKQK